MRDLCRTDSNFAYRILRKLKNVLQADSRPDRFNANDSLAYCYSRCIVGALKSSTLRGLKERIWACKALIGRAFPDDDYAAESEKSASRTPLKYQGFGNETILFP